MAVFFGKFSDTFPDQIYKGFYQTSRPDMFGDLNENDLVYAIGMGKIQLWRASTYTDLEGGKRMDFEILEPDLNINTSQLTLFKKFQINVDLVVHTIRQSPKAFFKIELCVENEDDLIDFEQYSYQNNYRKIHFVSDINDLNAVELNEDIVFVKDEHWTIYQSSFIDDVVLAKFNDNTSYLGRGRKDKDKVLKLINEASLPMCLTNNELPFLDLYDTYFCAYKPEFPEENEIDMLNIFPHKIYKLSQGKDFSIEEHKLLLKKGLVSVHKNTKAKGQSSITQGDSFINAKNGDYFYLCKGNDFIELIGRFNSNARPSEYDLFEDTDWYVRDFTTVCKSIKRSKYNGTSKWWTPKDNSTFIEIPPSEFQLANEKIFKPYFHTSIHSSKLNHEMKQKIDLLTHKKQIILQGAPGTGKTYATAELALRIINNNNIDSSNRKELMQAYQKAVEEGQIVFTTFHQSLDYEEFIEGIKPLQEGKDIIYDIVPGVFKKICKKAIQKDSFNGLQDAIDKFKEHCASSEEKVILKTIEGGKFTVEYWGGVTFKVRSTKSQAKEGQVYSASIANIEGLYKGEEKGMYSKSYVWGILNHLKETYNVPDYKDDKKLSKNYILIIDEINRGNISKIFGELITLLEADKRMGQINEIKCRLPYSNEEFSIPENLYIIGTMNTTDRSLGHIDYAVRRRFGFVSLESKVEYITEYYNNFTSNREGVSEKAVKLYHEVEKIVKENTSPEFLYKDIMVGHSYFMAESHDELALKLEYEIKPLLIEYIKDGILTIRMDDMGELLSNLD